MKEGWATENEQPPAPDPELREAPAVLARFKRALNLSLLALIALALCFWLQLQVPLENQALSIRPQDPSRFAGINCRSNAGPGKGTRRNNDRINGYR